LERITEHAGARLSVARHVSMPPGRPQALHRSQSYKFNVQSSKVNAKCKTEVAN
jgi:hypothetical protein